MVTPRNIFREGTRRGESYRYRLFGAGREEDREQGRRSGRLLAAFKAFAMLLLVGTTVFGLTGEGLYEHELRLPVATGVLALLFATVLTRGFYAGVFGEGWVLISLLALLVLVKGLSMIWTLSETETIRKDLRGAWW